MMDDPHEFLTTFLLALCIWREARSEPIEGQLAVGHVIANRVQDSRWPASYRDVILQPKQFSAFNQTDPQVVLYPQFDGAWHTALSAAQLVLGGLRKDPTKGANHYHTTGIQPPGWADPDKITARIGNHIFYKL